MTTEQKQDIVTRPAYGLAELRANCIERPEEFRLKPTGVLKLIDRIESLEAQLAEARKLPVFREACEMKRAGDQSVKIIFSSCRAASQVEKDVRSAGVQRGIESTKGKS